MHVALVSLLVLVAPAAVVQDTPPAPAPAGAAADANGGEARTPPELQIIPRPMGFGAIMEYIGPSIADDAQRAAAEARLRALWNGYVVGYEAPAKAEFLDVRTALNELNTKRPPTPDALRARYAKALVAVDRLDSLLFADMDEALQPESDGALAALKRARTRNLASLGLAGHLSLSVPIRWREPMRWLETTETRMPADAIVRFDTAMTELLKGLAPARRRFEFDIIVNAQSQQQFVNALPGKSKDFVTASREAATTSIAIVEALAGAIPPDDVARVHIARIEDLYLDTPRPERPCGADGFPSDVALRDAWFAERAKLAIADAEILRRYEEMALKTLAATPLWDRDAYDGRVFLAKSFKDERTKLHDETRARLELLNAR